ncbi:MAG: HAD family hydrolase [Tepidisphaeraceae bacterium]|jgi:HAD superfamily hydrolase (TIGR01509 family)
MLPPRAILFDLDGTITKPFLDFAQIRREMGVSSFGILEALADFPPDRRHEAERVLLQHERLAAEHSQLNPGCRELLGLIDGRLPRALITRNSRQSAQRVCELHALRFDLLVSREFGHFKPSPQPILHACTALGVAPADAWMVGDGRFDIEAGLAAGAKTIWVSLGHAKSFPADPWQTVRDLTELTQLLKDCLAS